MVYRCKQAPLDDSCLPASYLARLYALDGHDSEKEVCTTSGGETRVANDALYQLQRHRPPESSSFFEWCAAKADMQTKPRGETGAASGLGKEPLARSHDVMAVTHPGQSLKRACSLLNIPVSLRRSMSLVTALRDTDLRSRTMRPSAYTKVSGENNAEREPRAKSAADKKTPPKKVPSKMASQKMTASEETPTFKQPRREIDRWLQLRPFGARCQACSRLTVYRCRRCDDAFFCSRVCQIKAWLGDDGHRFHCVSIEDTADAAETTTAVSAAAASTLKSAAIARFQKEHAQRLRLVNLLHPLTQKDVENNKVQALMQLGSFGRSACRRALEKHGWDSEKAANHLFVFGTSIGEDSPSFGDTTSTKRDHGKSGNDAEDEVESGDVLEALKSPKSESIVTMTANPMTQPSPLRNTANVFLPVGGHGAGKRQMSCGGADIANDAKVLAALKQQGMSKSKVKRRIFNNKSRRGKSQQRFKQGRRVRKSSARSIGHRQYASAPLVFKSEVGDTRVVITAKWIYPETSVRDFGIILSVKEDADHRPPILPDRGETDTAAQCQDMHLGETNGDRSGGGVVDPWDCDGEFCPPEFIGTRENKYLCYAWVRELVVTELMLKWVWKQARGCSMGKGSWLKTSHQLKNCARCVVSAMSGPTILRDGGGKVIKSKNSGHRTFVLEDTLNADTREGLLADRMKKQSVSEANNSRASLSLIYESDTDVHGEDSAPEEGMADGGEADVGERKETGQSGELSASTTSLASSGLKSDVEMLTAKQLNAIETVKAVVGNSEVDQRRAGALLRSNNFDVEATMGIWFASNALDDSGDDADFDDMPELIHV